MGNHKSTPKEYRNQGEEGMGTRSGQWASCPPSRPQIYRQLPGVCPDGARGQRNPLSFHPHNDPVRRCQYPHCTGEEGGPGRSTNRLPMTTWLPRKGGLQGLSAEPRVTKKAPQPVSA